MCEPLDAPQLLVIGLIRTSTPKLIVEDDLTIGTERFEWLQIIVAGTWSAVQQEQGSSAGANASKPHSTALNADKAFSPCHVRCGAAA